ncbi:MAG TPA: tRNA (adenosine(37)-N6)-dimethylallyltransferase MiaA [Candidatus Riflebacteria bacterium]|jgi:tRNA dimethylallyltransferase|nr:tRNA (adenosine(37)-N6)-dimethylallyltransferase MiaA [Candidatus Riflebacteria bacterium]
MSEQQKKPILAVLGPTASGKTSLALELAERHGCEIVNCDSRQIYREMSIGTAHPTADEMRLAPHHLFSIVLPDRSFSAADYAEMATTKIRDIWQRGRVPLLAGGTGFYYDTLEQGLGPAGNDQKLAEQLRNELEKIGLAAMLERLQTLDPAASSQIDVNNARRVLRAIEIVTTTGRPLAENIRVSPLPEAAFMPVVVTRPRALLHDSISCRVEKMLKDGLESEVRGLVKSYGRHAPGLNSIGYSEWFDFFDEKISLAEVSEAMIIHTRQYAKRQETWFRRRPGPPIYDLAESVARAAIFANVAEFLAAFAL